MAAIVEYYAFGFQHQALKIRFLNGDASGRGCASRIDYSMPWDVALIVWCCVHRPAYESGAVTFLQQARDLAISHNPSGWDAQHEPINLFKHLVETGSRATLWRRDAPRFRFHLACRLGSFQRLGHKFTRRRKPSRLQLRALMDSLKTAGRMPALPGGVRHYPVKRGALATW